MFPNVTLAKKTVDILLVKLLMNVFLFILCNKQSQGTVSGTAVREILCDVNSPLNLQEILTGPNVVRRKLHEFQFE